MEKYKKTDGEKKEMIKADEGPAKLDRKVRSDWLVVGRKEEVDEEQEEEEEEERGGGAFAAAAERRWRGHVSTVFYPYRLAPPPDLSASLRTPLSLSTLSLFSLSLSSLLSL